MRVDIVLVHVGEKEPGKKRERTEELLQTIEVSQSHQTEARSVVADCMLAHARRLWKNDIIPVSDMSLFGGYMRNSLGYTISPR